jgi:hypothetical protein
LASGIALRGAGAIVQPEQRNRNEERDPEDSPPYPPEAKRIKLTKEQPEFKYDEPDQ